jgi:glutathione S-transferase
MITLYDKPECPFCYRVRAAVGFVGLEFERKDYDEPAAEREWRSLTPAKTVPVMVEGDLVLTDSAVMLEYLQDRTGMLLPESPSARARVRTLLHYADNPLGRGSREVVFAKRGQPESDWDAERIAAGTKQFVESLPHLEGLLAGRDSFFDGYTFADSALSTRLCLSAAYGLEVPADYPRLRAWFTARLAEEWLLAASPPVVLAWLEEEAALAIG